MSKLIAWKTIFDSVGWFIPPYVQLGYIDKMSSNISSKGSAYHQQDLENDLSRIYDAEGLSALVLHRFPHVPHIKDYKQTIAEAVEAHFFGLNKVAVAGLLPAIEGSARKIAASQKLTKSYVKEMFQELTEHCKQESKSKKLGAWDEVEIMMDSFMLFINNHLFVNSALYTLQDKTNRHGILHGAYSDADFGAPINFYKAISSITILTFIQSMWSNVSWMHPDSTMESLRLGAYYFDLPNASKIRAGLLANL